MNPRIRPIAIGIIERDDHLFVFRGHDHLKPETFYRPVGGAIEFGERAEETLRREFLEELGAELNPLHLLGATENIFIHNGLPGHEIVMVFAAEFTKEEMYDFARVWQGNDEGVPFEALWMPLEAFRRGEAILYPDGLLSLIDDSESD